MPIGCARVWPLGGHFGWCPTCHHADGYVNIGRPGDIHHWAFCDTHRTRWCIGANLFPTWQQEERSVWEGNAQRVGDYADVDDLPAGDDMIARWITAFAWINQPLPPN